MKPGDKVVVTAKLFGHGFELGEEIELVEYGEECDNWLCTNGRYEWFLTEQEFKAK